MANLLCASDAGNLAGQPHVCGYFTALGAEVADAEHPSAKRDNLEQSAGHRMLIPVSTADTITLSSRPSGLTRRLLLLFEIPRASGSPIPDPTPHCPAVRAAPSAP
jgi:hypothetical protein